MLVLEHDLDATAQQAGVHAIAYAHAHVGRNLQPVRGFEHQVRDAVGDVLSLGVRPAELEVGRVAQQQAGQVKGRLLVGQHARRHVALVKGREQHVQPP